MHRRHVFWFVVIFALIRSQSVVAATPTWAELAEAQRWALAKFDGTPETGEGLGLYVLDNLNPVQLNARRGKPLRIGNQSFHRGLYCHAHSQIVVQTGHRGGVFSAVVGVDSNEQTIGGRGSVHFAVQAGGRERFKSPLLREGAAGAVVKVALDGAREFALLVEDVGDGIACDQADWAEARVKLKDGRELWLAELPLIEGGARAAEH